MLAWMLRSIRKLLDADRKNPISKRDIARFLPANPVIVEAGGHLGHDTVRFADYMPGCQVHVFEPVPELFSRLQKRTTTRTEVVCYPMALGDSNTTADFYLSSGGSDGSSSLMRPREHLILNPDVLFKETIQVQVVRLSDWARDHAIEKVDLLWLDLQGNELAALKGAQTLLPSVTAVYSEVNLVDFYEGVPLYHEVRTWMLQAGFRIAMVDFRYESQGNVLFVRNKPPAVLPNEGKK